LSAFVLAERTVLCRSSGAPCHNGSSTKLPTETRIAIAGYGLIGQRHAAIINQTPGLALAGVADDAPDKRAAAKALACPIHDDLAALLAAEAPDGVVLATPTANHAEQALACIRAGVPTLIEKPIAACVAEARQVVTAATAANLPLLIGHHRRYNGIIEAARATLERGIIGAIRAIHATCWLAKPDSYFQGESWRQQPGAGPVSINLVHDVDLLRVLCGEVESVQAMAAPSRRGFDNEDLAAAILRFRGGAIATLSVADCIAAPWSWELTAQENPAYPCTASSCYLIGGTEGSLSLPDLTLWQHAANPDWKTPMTPRTLVHESTDPLRRQMAHFASVLQGTAAPAVPGIEGLKSLEVIEAILAASRTGCSVPVGEGWGSR